MSPTDPPVPTAEEAATWQRRLASQANNRAWTLAEAPARSPAEDDEMLHAAHAAMHLWSIVGDDGHRAHAHQLLAHVHALLGHAGEASRFLARSQPQFLESEAAPWERALAHAVAAHVAAVCGERDLHRAQHAQARRCIDALPDPQDREILEATMRVVPTP